MGKIEQAYEYQNVFLIAESDIFNNIDINGRIK